MLVKLFVLCLITQFSLIENVCGETENGSGRRVKRFFIDDENLYNFLRMFPGFSFWSSRFPNRFGNGNKPKPNNGNGNGNPGSQNQEPGQNLIQGYNNQWNPNLAQPNQDYSSGWNQVNGNANPNQAYPNPWVPYQNYFNPNQWVPGPNNNPNYWGPNQYYTNPWGPNPNQWENTNYPPQWNQPQLNPNQNGPNQNQPQPNTQQGSVNGLNPNNAQPNQNANAGTNQPNPSNPNVGRDYQQRVSNEGPHAKVENVSSG